MIFSRTGRGFVSVGQYGGERPAVEHCNFPGGVGYDAGLGHGGRVRLLEIAAAHRKRRTCRVDGIATQCLSRWFVWVPQSSRRCASQGCLMSEPILLQLNAGRWRRGYLDSWTGRLGRSLWYSESRFCLIAVCLRGLLPLRSRDKWSFCQKRIRVRSGRVQIGSARLENAGLCFWRLPWRCLRLRIWGACTSLLRLQLFRRDWISKMEFIFPDNFRHTLAWNAGK